MSDKESAEQDWLEQSGVAMGISSAVGLIEDRAIELFLKGGFDEESRELRDAAKNIRLGILAKAKGEADKLRIKMNEVADADPRCSCCGHPLSVHPNEGDCLECVCGGFEP